MRAASPSPSPAHPTRFRFDSSFAFGVAAFLAILPFVIAHQHARFDVETDFMWEYGPYARRLLRGDLPASFPYRGPGYHLLLALAGLFVRDLFLAGKLLSAASFGVVTGLVASLARRTRPGAPSWLAALAVAGQPLLLLHAWSVGTDLVFAAVALLAVWLLIPREGSGAGSRDILVAGLAGLVAGYAWLIRPNGLFLLPAGAMILVMTGGARGEGGGSTGGLARRIRQPAAFTAAFLLPMLLWLLVFHTVHGSWPATMNYRNLAAATWPEVGKMTPDLYQKTFELEIRGYGDLLRKRGAELAVGSLRHLPPYAGRYLRDVCGWPIFALGLTGLLGAIALRPRPSRRFWALPLAGLWAFLILVPLYYEARFALFLGAPIALLAVSLAGSDPFLPGHRARQPLLIGLVLVALVAIGFSVQASRRMFIFESPSRPYDAAGAMIRARTDLPGGICARKPHIAFAADRRLVGFPDAALTALPDSLRVRGAAFLFYGPAELELVPRYAALLDPGMIPPGLRLIRVDPGLQFGLLFQILPSNTPSPVTPELVAAMRNIHETLEANGIWERVRRRLATDAMQNASFLISRGRFAEAVEPLEQFITLFPDVSDGHRLLGWAEVDLGRGEEGLAHLDRAVVLGGLNSEIAVNRARALLLLGRTAGADSTLDQALARWPDVPDLVVLKGYASYHLGREAEARSWWEKAQRRWPDDPRAKGYLEAMERGGVTN